MPAKESGQSLTGKDAEDAEEGAGKLYRQDRGVCKGRQKSFTAKIAKAAKEK